MTEQEWLKATDPTPMLEFLRSKASERKLRLLMIACARLLWERIPSGEMREAVEAAERCADGVPWEDELTVFCDRLYRMPVDAGRTTGQNWFKDQSAEELGVYFTVLKTTGAGCGVLNIIPKLATSTGGPFILPLIGARMPDLIRDIFGNPFRPVAVEPLLAHVHHRSTCRRRLPRSCLRPIVDLERCPSRRRVRKRQYPAPLPTTE